MRTHASYGCGGPDCPLCAAGVALETERLHREAVARTTMQGQPRTTEDVEPEDDSEARAYVRGTRALARANARIKRVSPRTRDAALAQLLDRPIRKCYDRDEWLAEVWLEYEQPSITVAKREGDLDWMGRLSKAVKRGEKVLQGRIATKSLETSPIAP